MSEPLHVLVAGGGFAGVEVVLALRALAGSRVRLDLLSNTDTLRFRPLAVNEPFGLGAVEHVRLDDLCADQAVARVRARATRIDVPAHAVMTDATPPLGYDVLVVAVGARRAPALPGAVTFEGARGVVELQRLVDELAAGATEAVVFTAPGDSGWTLPVYELALLTEAELRRRGVTGASIAVVTPERAPLEIFGSEAAGRIASLLRDRGIALHRESTALRLGAAHGRAALITTAGAVPADRVVALPRLAGPGLAGLATDPDGFIPIDPHGLVHGTASVYAAGDATTYPVKQGGLATQQADAVAVSIAARAGVPVDPRPFDPRLRALLLTGGVPLELGGPGGGVVEAPESRWADKVVGRHLSRWLAERGRRPDGDATRAVAH